MGWVGKGLRLSAGEQSELVTGTMKLSASSDANNFISRDITVDFDTFRIIVLNYFLSSNIYLPMYMLLTFPMQIQPNGLCPAHLLRKLALTLSGAFVAV